MKTKHLLGLLSLILATGPGRALAPGDVVENFRLADQNGRSHQLYSSSNSKAVVLMIQGNGCPIVRHAMPTLKDIRTRYEGQGVEFMLMNSNLQDNRESIAAEAKEFDYNMPILVDQAQLIGEALGVQRTSEVFVIDPKSWKLVYRGPIDDRVSYEKQRPKATNNYLADALDDMLAGRKVRVAKAEGVGCLVNFPERNHKKKATKASRAANSPASG
jgi:peroxiredoxin